MEQTDYREADDTYPRIKYCSEYPSVGRTAGWRGERARRKPTRKYVSTTAGLEPPQSGHGEDPCRNICRADRSDHEEARRFRNAPHDEHD